METLNLLKVASRKPPKGIEACWMYCDGFVGGPAINLPYDGSDRALHIDFKVSASLPMDICELILS